MGVIVCVCVCVCVCRSWYYGGNISCDTYGDGQSEVHQ